MLHRLIALKNHKWLVIISGLLLALAIFVPMILQYSVQKIVLEQGKHYGIDRVEIVDIDFNPLLAKVSLEGLSLYRQNELFAQVGLLEANISVFALLKQQLLIESLYLGQTNLPIHFISEAEQKTLNIAGIAIPLNTPQEKEAAKEESSELAINIGVESLIIEALSVDFELFDGKTSKGKSALKVKTLTISEEADFHRLILHSHLNQTPLDANLQLHPFDAQPKILGTLDLNQLSFAKLRYIANHFSPQFAHYLSGSLSNNLTFTLTKTPTGVAYYQQGSIKLQNLKIQQDTLKADLKQFRWKGDFHFIHDNGQQPSNQSIHLHGQANLDGLQLDLPEQKIQLSQNLSSELNLDLQITPQQLVLTQAGSLTLTNLTAKQAPYNAQLKQLKWQGNLNFSQNLTEQKKDADAAKNAENALPAMQFALNGSLDLQKFNSQHQQNRLEIAQFDALNISHFEIEQLKRIALSQLSLKQLSLAKPQSEQAVKQTALTQIETIQLDQLLLTDSSGSGAFNQLTLGDLRINNSQTQLNIDENGQIALVNQLLTSLPTSSETKADAGTKSQKATKTADKQSSTFNYQLKSLQVAGKNQINLETRFDPKAIKKAFYLKSFKLGAIDSQKPKKKVAFKLSLEFDEFSKLNSQGEVQLLNPTQYLQAKTDIESLSLLELSPFAEKYAGYQINSGQLSAELTTHIQNSTLDAKNSVHLHQLEVANTDKGEEFKKSLNMPLDLGVALLKDKQDNIHLEVPINGKLDELKVGLQDVISTALNNALVKASSSYLKLALQPFGAIWMAGQFAADQLTAIKLQAIEFEPGQSELAPEMKTYLSKINKLLTDRKAVQIKLCGGVKEEDRPALQKIVTLAAQKAAEEEALALSKKSGQEVKAEPVEEIVISDEQLFALAQERKAAIKRYLIKLGSASKQITLCKAVIQSSEGQPNVEVGL